MSEDVWWKNPVKISIASAVLSTVVAIASSTVSTVTSLSVQQRQVDLDFSGKFVSESAQVSQAGGEFISQVNTKKDLSAARLKLNAAVIQQIEAIPRLSSRLGLSQQDAETFRSALKELIAQTNVVISPDQMPQWAEAFGRALDADRVLTGRLYRRFGDETKVSER